MKRFFTALCLCIGAIASSAQSTYPLDSTILTSRIVVDSIDIPWEIIWGPDGHIWMTERIGRVSRIDPSTGQKELLLNLTSQVYQQSESGMLGMVLHPDFAQSPYVYLVYTYLSGSNIRERLVRYQYNGTNLVSPTTLIDNIPANSTHDGSRLIILPDSTMLMTTGDAQQTSLPQNTNSLVGKVLRINLDGTVPTDNPISGSYVYSWGHRNAQGLWLAPNGHIYCSEHGPTTDDELHIINKGRNYGWPTVAGFCDSPPEITFCADSNVVEPLVAWTPTIAPSDIIWYDHPSIPEFKDKLLMTVLKDKRLIAFGFNAAGDSVVSERHYLQNQFGRLRDICISPDGKIYLATNGQSWSNTNPNTHRIIELYNAAYSPPTAVEGLVGKIEEPMVWPNPLPSGQALQVRLPFDKEALFSVYDALGRCVYTQALNTKDCQLPIALPSGIYFWQISAENYQKAGKLELR